MNLKPTVGKYSSPIGKYTIHTLIRHGMGMVAPPTPKAFLTLFFVVVFYGFQGSGWTTHLKNMLIKLDDLPGRGKNKTWLESKNYCH